MTPETLGRYEILGELGKGAMGVVYLAQDPLIQRQLAIKTFRMAYSAKEKEVQQFRERFLREAQAIGQLSHPNIVTVHDVGQEEDEYFIAMEYIKGINLKAKMQAVEERLALDFVIDVTAQIAEGLACAHEKGIVHRDVKPANIIITQTGRVKITDFGIARIEQSNLTVAGQLLGTPNYMAPEQIQGKPVDARTDIFSLGVLLYEMLTRKKPFAGENLTQVSHRIVYDDFTSPSEYVETLPQELLRVLDRALEKDPDERYQDAAEMAQDLRVLQDPSGQLSGQIPVVSPPAPAPASPGREAPTASASASLPDESPEKVPAESAPAGKAQAEETPASVSPVEPPPPALAPSPTVAPSSIVAPSPTPAEPPVLPAEPPVPPAEPPMPPAEPPMPPAEPPVPPVSTAPPPQVREASSTVSPTAVTTPIPRPPPPTTAPSVPPTPLQPPPVAMSGRPAPPSSAGAPQSTASAQTSAPTPRAVREPRPSAKSSAKPMAAKPSISASRLFGRGRLGLTLAVLIVAGLLVGLALSQLFGSSDTVVESPDLVTPEALLAEEQDLIRQAGRRPEGESAEQALVRMLAAVRKMPYSTRLTRAYFELAEQADLEHNVVEAYVEERMAFVEAFVKAQQYESAYDILERILLVDPDHETAAQRAEDIERFLDRRRKRIRTPSQPPPRRQATSTQTPVPNDPPESTSLSPVELAISFRTLIAEGKVTVFADGTPIWQKEFRFDNRKPFRRKYLKGPRGYDETYNRDPGTVELKVEVEVDTKDGMQSQDNLLRAALEPGTRPTLQIEVGEDAALRVSWMP